jgi:hypothetical protein
MLPILLNFGEIDKIEGQFIEFVEFVEKGN